MCARASHVGPLRRPPAHLRCSPPAPAAHLPSARSPEPPSSSPSRCRRDGTPWPDGQQRARGHMVYRAERRLSPAANQQTGQPTVWVDHPGLANGRQRVHIEPWPPSRRLPKTSSAAATHAVSTVLTSWGGRGSLLACLEPAPPADPTRRGLVPPAGRRGRGGRTSVLTPLGDSAHSANLKNSALLMPTPPPS